MEHNMKSISLAGVGQLILCDIPIHQQVPPLKGKGGWQYLGHSQDSNKAWCSPHKPQISVGSLTTAVASDHCEDTSPPDIPSKGSHHLSFYLWERGIQGRYKPTLPVFKLKPVCEKHNLYTSWVCQSTACLQMHGMIQAKASSFSEPIPNQHSWHHSWNQQQRYRGFRMKHQGLQFSKPTSTCITWKEQLGGLRD